MLTKNQALRVFKTASVEVAGKINALGMLDCKNLPREEIQAVLDANGENAEFLTAFSARFPLPESQVREAGKKRARTDATGGLPVDVITRLLGTITDHASVTVAINPSDVKAAEFQAGALRLLEMIACYK